MIFFFVTECAANNNCNGNGVCFDDGFYGDYTCSCNDNFEGRDCELTTSMSESKISVLWLRMALLEYWDNYFLEAYQFHKKML